MSDVADFDSVISELKLLITDRSRNILDEKFNGVNRLCEILGTDSVNGLKRSQEEVKRRQLLFGTNQLDIKQNRERKNFFMFVREAMNDVILFILIIAAVLSIILSFVVSDLDVEGEDGFSEAEGMTSAWIEGGAILGAVFVIVFMTAFNDWKKDRQFTQLHSQLEKDLKVAVISNRETVNILKKDLVVGDICLIKHGDTIPGDGVLVEGSELKIDESILTGETDLIGKSTGQDYRLLAGTSVMDGTGKMVVVAVGNSTLSAAHTAVAEIEEKGLSAIKAKLLKLTIFIGYVGLIMALLTTLVLLIRFTTETYAMKPSWEFAMLKDYINFFIFGVTVLVLAIPEGLPLAVTLALAYSVKKMMTENVLVRNLDVFDTMGNATSICTDKTGMLTTNRMTVVECYIEGKYYRRSLTLDDLSSKTIEILEDSICLNSNYASHLEHPEKKMQLPIQVGNKTECALLFLLDQLGISYHTVRKRVPHERIIKVYPFNPSRKSMTTIFTPYPGKYFILTKGATEVILEKCNYKLMENDNLFPISPEDRTKIKGVIKNMTDNALRTICLGYREIFDAKALNKQHVGPDDDEVRSTLKSRSFHEEYTLTKEFILLAIFGIEDPLRPEAADSIASCQSAGITVRMLTGDNLETARSVALKCGIIEYGKEHIIMEGKQFNEFIRVTRDGPVVQELMDIIWPNLRVLARSTPQDKYNLVTGILNSKIHTYREVVAVTGDGTNDAAALKIADVGFAMGLSGTDVAKLASDIILVDDNFAGIVKSIMWGRNVYDSISKFLQFQLTVNIVAVSITFIGACFFRDTPLKAVQMLYLNLIMDTFASLALATESPTKEILGKRPRGRKKPLVTKMMIKNIVGHSFYQLSVIILLLVYGPDMCDVDSALYNRPGHVSKHFVIIYNTFVMMTLFNEINSRKLRDELNVLSGVHTNRLFLLIWSSTFVAQVFIIQYGGNVFRTMALTTGEWMWCMVFGAGEIVWGEVLTLVPLTEIKDDSQVTKGGYYRADFTEDVKFMDPQSVFRRGFRRFHAQLQVFRAIETRERKKDNLSMKSQGSKKDKESIKSKFSSKGKDSVKDKLSQKGKKDFDSIKEDVSMNAEKLEQPREMVLNQLLKDNKEKEKKLEDEKKAPGKLKERNVEKTKENVKTKSEEKNKEKDKETEKGKEKKKDKETEKGKDKETEKDKEQEDKKKTKEKKKNKEKAKEESSKKDK